MTTSTSICFKAPLKTKKEAVCTAGGFLFIHFVLRAARNFGHAFGTFLRRISFAETIEAFSVRTAQAFLRRIRTFPSARRRGYTPPCPLFPPFEKLLAFFWALSPEQYPVLGCRHAKRDAFRRKRLLTMFSYSIFTVYQTASRNSSTAAPQIT